MEKSIRDFQEALLMSDAIKAKSIFSAAKEKNAPEIVIENLIVDVLGNIGKGWETGVYALSQVYMSGRICEDLVEELLPPESGLRKSSPKMAIALLNDYHALGKRIVFSVLRAGGYDLLDYGRVDEKELVTKIMQDKIEVILLSVLMYPSALNVKSVRKMLTQQGYDAKIVVGGAPFRLDKELWHQVGADAAGYTAADALKIINSVCGGDHS